MISVEFPPKTDRNLKTNIIHTYTEYLLYINKKRTQHTFTLSQGLFSNVEYMFKPTMPRPSILRLHCWNVNCVGSNDSHSILVNRDTSALRVFVTKRRIANGSHIVRQVSKPINDCSNKPSRWNEFHLI